MLKRILLVIIIYANFVLNTAHKEDLSLNKPSLNKLESYTRLSVYNFNFINPKAEQSKYEVQTTSYFVFNSFQYLEPVLFSTVGQLSITAFDNKDVAINYFDSKELFHEVSNSKYTEKWMNFNENFFAVPLTNFKSFMITLTIDPTKLKGLDINSLQDQLDTISSPAKPLTEMHFSVQVFDTDNIALVKDAFYPVYLNPGKAGVILEVNHDQIDKDNIMFIEILNCGQNTNSDIGEIEVQYYTSGATNNRQHTVKSDSEVIQLDQDEDTKMIMIKIGRQGSEKKKKSSKTDVFFKVRLRSVKKAHEKIVEREVGIKGLKIALEDMSQIPKGEEIFSKFIGLNVKYLNPGETFRISENVSGLDLVSSDFDRSQYNIYVSKDPKAPCMKCGFNPEIFFYYNKSIKQTTYPLKFKSLKHPFVQISLKEPEQDGNVILDLRKGYYQGLVSLYIKKTDFYNQELRDLGMNISTSAIFGVCSNYPGKRTVWKLLFYVLVFLLSLGFVFLIWFLGKKKLGEMGEESFDREEEIERKGFEMVTSTSQDLKDERLSSNRHSTKFDGYDYEVGVDDEHGFEDEKDDDF